VRGGLYFLGGGGIADLRQIWVNRILDNLSPSFYHFYKGHHKLVKDLTERNGKPSEELVSTLTLIKIFF
jgi:hypothetical protein